MPNSPRTQHRSIRIPDETWVPLLERTKTAGTGTGEITRQFYDWYLRRDGAKLPTRPPADVEPSAAE